MWANSPFHRAFCRWYMHWIYFPFFDHHIAVSEHVAAELVAASRRHAVRRGSGFAPWSRRNPVLADRRSAAMRQSLLRKSNGGPGTLLLLYAGRLAPEKNLPMLIGMMHSLQRDRTRDYRLILVAMAYSAKAWSNSRPGRRRAEFTFLTTSPIASGWLRSMPAVTYSSSQSARAVRHRTPRGHGLRPTASGGKHRRNHFLCQRSHAWLAEPTQRLCRRRPPAFQDHGARLAKVREGLALLLRIAGIARLWRTFPFMTQSTPNFGPWIHLPAFPLRMVYARNPLCRYSDCCILGAGPDALPRRGSLRTPEPQFGNPISSYVQMVPSVTAGKRNQQSLCILEGQTRCGRTITLPPIWPQVVVFSGRKPPRDLGPISTV